MFYLRISTGIFLFLLNSNAFCQSYKPDIMIYSADGDPRVLPEPFNGGQINVAVGEAWQFAGSIIPANSQAVLSLVAEGNPIQSYQPYLYSMPDADNYYSSCLYSEPPSSPPCPYFGWTPFSGPLPPANVEGAWYSPGSYAVTLSVLYPNQPPASYSGTVNVQMPTNIGERITISTPQVWPVSPSSATSMTQYLGLGSYVFQANPNGSYGIVFDSSQIIAPFGYTGRSVFHQFIEAVTINYFLNGKLIMSCLVPKPSDGTSVYDGTPYVPPTGGAPTEAKNLDEDAPNIQLPANTPTVTYDKVDIRENYVNYLYWAAQKYAAGYLFSSVPIAMGKVDWSWHGEADWSATQNAWVINQSNSSAPQPVFTSVPTSTYQQWSQSAPVGAPSPFQCSN